jgi:hypothetical protein
MSETRALNYQEEGRRLLTAFYGALSALKLYPVENETVQQALAELHSLMERVVHADGGAEVRVVGDFFFLNETRLRLDLSNFATFGSFASALHMHGIGAVEIDPGVEGSEWAPFISMLLRKPAPESPPFEGAGAAHQGPFADGGRGSQGRRGEADRREAHIRAVGEGGEGRSG